ncbi:PREDICTED: UV-stimulated scaffold protein A homolog [Nelumbo nucifera]|uniref:UV-stimulated scaffold protein A homolog n=1 Tax=Nelumbo nucifera TaxID=4432 RepID=A0A1U8AWF4_NELNU|nr:PREDICTED: UV-stimulated scaffold protein A homolog [Nelumbo nucifera]
MGESGGKVNTLIEKATNSTAPEVDPRLLKAIKLVVRSSDAEVRLAAETLMEKMKRDHSQVRYLALLIVDQLFMRSKLFRSLLVVNFDKFLSLSVGFRRNLPLPAPAPIASILRSKAIEFLEKWNVAFGVHYRQLRLGFDYLKNTLRFQFPNLQQNAARLQQQRQEREARSREILLKKFEILRENLSSIRTEIQSTVDEIGECLDIVSTKEDTCMPTCTTEEDDVEEFRCSALQQIRLDSLKEGEKVRENSDNKVVFDVLRELYKLLVTRHLVSVQEWISVLVRVEPEDKRFRDSTLKELIDIRNHLMSVKKKCEHSGLTHPSTGDREEEVLWEEGKVEVYEHGNSSIPRKASEHLPSTSTMNDGKNKYTDCSKELKGGEFLDDEGNGSDSAYLRRKLLAEAPVITWGSFLDNWGSNRDVLANQRGLEIEGHWGRVDYDAVIPAEKIAELNVQATLYKEAHVEIQPCRAPLSKGGLCQRRDLKVCPFHGPIVFRDAKGNPINENPLTDEETLDLGSKVIEQLMKQAVKNVRDRDMEEAKKKENDRQSIKRAKLAKVRKHNEAVLCNAAITSTSRSEILGDVEVVSGSKHAVREKKQTLASMLRKKVTAKDRLSQRLLKTRATATGVTARQPTGEDAKYREAYPNQW